MIGRKNLAVIELAGGRQILLAEGEKFGPGSNSIVLAVSENEVVIKVNGKVQTLPLGGN
jgi:type II secretory pathway component PulC